jgi:hypothetical protein
MNILTNTCWDHLSHGIIDGLHLSVVGHPLSLLQQNLSIFGCMLHHTLFSLQPKMDKFNHKLNKSPLVQIATKPIHFLSQITWCPYLACNRK